MIANKYKRLTPQQRYELMMFVRAVKSRRLRTNDLRYVLVLLRECTRDDDFKEWGSAIAHIERDRGWLFQNAISIWATHVYYEFLDRRNIRLSPLPADIFDSIVTHLKRLSPREIADQYGHIVPSGTSSEEIIATMDHLYSRPAKQRKNREMGAFYHFVSEDGIESSDKALLRCLITQVEDKALSIGPRPLSQIVTSIEQAICGLGFGDGLFDQEDKQFLQLHLLVAFHALVIDICPKAFFALTGKSFSVQQTIVFVSAMEKVLTLDVGFFEIDESGFFQPAYIRPPYSIFTLERCYYPIVASDLCSVGSLAEQDENVRYSLYGHALKVVRKKGEFLIVASHGIPDSEWFPSSKQRKFS